VLIILLRLFCVILVVYSKFRAVITPSREELIHVFIWKF